MKNKYYICGYVNTCQYAGTKDCIYGASGGISEIILNKQCGGNFRPQFTIYCDHPEVRVGVILVNTSHARIEGNYHNIWTPF